MRLTEAQYQEILTRFERCKGRDRVPSDAVEDEVSGLHEPIIAWCRSQWPVVPYIHARTDKKSTINLGAPDLTLFYRGKCILIEAKSKTGKLSAAQLAWRLMAEKQGFTTHVIRSMEEFHALVQSVI